MQAPTNSPEVLSGFSKSIQTAFKGFQKCLNILKGSRNCFKHSEKQICFNTDRNLYDLYLLSNFSPIGLNRSKKNYIRSAVQLNRKNKIASVQPFNRSFSNGLSSRFLSVLLPCVQQFKKVFAWEVTFHIMSIAVMISLVVSVSESGKRGLFWIVYNNYSTKALLNSFELYLSIIGASKK